MLLVITGKDDATADLVCTSLRKFGAKFFRLNTDAYPTDIQISLSYSKQRFSGVIADKRNEYALSCFETVWFRKPAPPRISKHVASGKATEFAEQESGAVLSSLYHLLKRARWVSHPEAIRRANHKAFQLSTAQKLGFRIPTTLITSSPAEASRFCASRSQALVKPLKMGMIEYAKKVELIYSSLITQNDLANFDSVRFAPCLFQEYIEKQFEVRVTIIGRKIFAMRLNTQQSDTSRIDWRRGQCKGVSYEMHKLPAQIERQLLRFMKNYDLLFSAFDLIVTPANEYVFLENNPNGQWAWLDLELPCGMIDYMSRFLGHRGSHGLN